MESQDLTNAQAAAIVGRLRPTLGYLNRLERRMETCGFPPDDRLLVLVREARDAMHGLTVAMHYTGCCGQVGRRG
jgi:hypothetical protein